MEGFMPDQYPDWLKVARLMLLSREMDRLEAETLAPQGKVKYQFSAGGHELAQVLMAQSLTHPHDAAAVYYRSRPFLLASGLSPAEALSAGMARRNSPSEGRDVGVVFNLPRRRGATILPASGDVGAQYTPAVGWAQAILYRQRVMGESDWEGAVVVACGGEGSTATGGFWAALNIAAPLDLPFIFFIEDNGFGISVRGELQNPRGNIASNLACYNCLKIIDADGTQPGETWQAIQAALEHTRNQKGACLLRLRVPRLAGHTLIDDQAYKTPEEREADARRDPLLHLREYLLHDQGLADETWEGMREEIHQEIEQALAIAQASPEPEVRHATRFLFYEGTPPLQGGLRPEAAQLPLDFTAARTVVADPGPRINLVEAVRRTLEVELEKNPRLVIFGEDVGVKGGVHGATRDLQVHFGSERVFDTSLNEDGIIGRATGLALAGLLPAPEIQFRKYADPAHEQLNDLGTLRWRTANKFAAPVVVRIPVGYGKKTGDPWHSVSGEAIFVHTPGWRIAYPSNAADAVGLLRAALRGDDPTLFFEHRALLDTAEGRRPYPGDDYCLPFGSAGKLLEGSELLVVTWGAMVYRCLAAAQGLENRITLLDLRTISPWDQEAVINGVRDTGKVLVVHEDTLTGGFGGEIIAFIASEGFPWLDAPPTRLAVPDIPIPYSVSLMEAVLPSVESIRKKIIELLAY